MLYYLLFWTLLGFIIHFYIIFGTNCENPELTSRPSYVYLSTPGSLLTTQRNDIIAQYVKGITSLNISCHKAYIEKCLMTFITTRKQRKVQCVATPSQPQAVDVVHVTSLLQIAIVVVVIIFVPMQLCCQQNYCHEYITYSICLPWGRT